MPCKSAAKSISDALGGALLPQLVESVCVAALNVVADGVSSKINAIVFKDVQIAGGAAALLDVSQAKPKEDYQSDRVAQGKWDWSFTVAGCSVKVPSVFEGDRIGDAQ